MVFDHGAAGARRPRGAENTLMGAVSFAPMGKFFLLTPEQGWRPFGALYRKGAESMAEASTFH
jgi:hypothetical protein